MKNISMVFDVSVQKSPYGNNNPITMGQSFIGKVNNVTSNNYAILTTSGDILKIHSNEKLQVGDILKLEVAQVGNPLKLKIIEIESFKNVFQSTLRNVLPNQMPYSPLLNNLLWIQNNPIILQKMPIEFTQFLQRLSQFVYNIDELDSSILKSSLLNSGLYLESKLQSLIQKSPLLFLQNDFKAFLYQLLELIRIYVPARILDNAQGNYPKSAPPPLLLTDAPRAQKPSKPNISVGMNSEQILSVLFRQAESALSRLTLTQLFQYSSEELDKPTYSFELPFHHHDGISIIFLGISQFNRDKNKKNSSWRINLVFDLYTLGELNISIYIMEKILMLQIWAVEKSTLEIFKKHFQYLENKLTESGFKISSVSYNIGTPPKEKNHSRIQHSIIDESI